MEVSFKLERKILPKHLNRNQPQQENLKNQNSQKPEYSINIIKTLRSIIYLRQNHLRSVLFQHHTRNIPTISTTIMVSIKDLSLDDTQTQILKVIYYILGPYQLVSFPCTIYLFKLLHSSQSVSFSLPCSKDSNFADIL